MDHVDLILRLKDLFRDTCEKQVISRLIQLPLIVEYLNDPDNFQLIVDKFGKDCHRWNLFNICIASNGFNQKSSSTIGPQIHDDAEIERIEKSLSPQSIRAINSIEEIYSFANKINALRTNLQWSQIFEKIGLGIFSFKDPKKILETIFEVSFELTDDKNYFVESLIESEAGKNGQKMLSRLVLNNHSIRDFVFHAFETQSIDPKSTEFVSLMKELRFLGDQEIHKNLAEVYLKNNPFHGNSQLNETRYEIADILSYLQYLKNYSVLFQIIGNIEELDKASSTIKNILADLGQGLGFTAHFEEVENQDHKEFRKNNSDKDYSREYRRIKEIANMDSESAKALALEFSSDLLKEPDILNSIFDKDHGFLIEPQTLIQFLIDYRLFPQARSVLNKFLLQWPNNSQLLRIAANLTHDKGDHKYAAEKFALLDINDELTREEKIKFALSLEYSEAWENAYEIRKTINISTVEDFRDILICALHAGKFNDLKTLISENGRLIKSSKISSLIMKVAEEDKEQIILDMKNLGESDYSNEKYHYYFCLISDYLEKIGEIDFSIGILENCIRYSKFSLSIINRLFSVYQKRGEREKYRSILSSIKNPSHNNQKEIEIFIDLLVQSGEIERANKLLLEIENNWELSPQKTNLEAKILIEKGKFSEAEKILSPFVQDLNNDFNIQLNYCLAVLKCSLENFPFGINKENQEQVNELRKIIRFDTEEKSLLKELLNAELAPGSRFEKYQHFLNIYLSSSDPDVWRIYAGLGKIYFDLNQFDSAIINLKRAHQIQPNNQFLFWLLVQSYANLRLWNEIENLLNLDMAQDCPSILTNIKEFGILSENSEWPHFLENQIQRRPEEIVYKVFLAQYFAGKSKSTEAVEIMKGFFEKLEVESDLYLICIQIFVDSNETQLAERLIEIFLVNKKSPRESDYLACAFLFEQLGRPEKALAMMNRTDAQDFALITYKSKLMNDLGKVEQFQKLMNSIIEKDDQLTNSLNDMKVKIPDFVKQIQENPSIVYSMAAFSTLKEKGIDNAISILERGLKKNQHDQAILLNLLEMLNLTGKSEKIEGLLEKLNGYPLINQSSSLLCLLGEIALARGEEIKGAQYLSAALKLAPEDLRIKTLQARIVAINGNAKDAKQILDEIISVIDKTNQEKIVQATENYIYGSRYWLAKAVLDLKENKKALEICQQEILRFGYLPPLVNLFLSAYAAELENEFILHEIKANSYFDETKDEFQKIFTQIIENRATSHSESNFQNEMINKCRIFLENDLNALAEGEKLNSDPDHINSKTYAIFKLKGLEAAEIAFNSFTTDENNELFLAVLEKDLSPEKSLIHLQRSMRTSSPDAIRNALLAAIERNLGNFSEAYAAICLALETCPNEYEWQVMAGDLCQLNGDLHASIGHYQQAQSINLTKSIHKQIDSLYLTLGTPEAIPILEMQLSQNPNFDQTIQLGKIYIKTGNYRKAVKVFESAINNFPQKADSYYWLSEIALNLENPGKALGNIEYAILRDGLNSLYLCKKAEIIYKIKGFPQAISYLDEELEKKENNDFLLLKYKVKLITEHDGEKEALKVLNLAISQTEIPQLMLEKANLELRLGKLNESELIAEKLLEINEVKAEALALLGAISKTKGEFDRAIDFYVKSIEADPFSVEKFVQLAEIYHDRKEFKNATKTLEDGMRSNPGNFELLYRTGLYFYQQGGYNEAGKFIREAIKIKPDHRESKELLGLLDNVLAVRNYSFADQITE